MHAIQENNSLTLSREEKNVFNKPQNETKTPSRCFNSPLLSGIINPSLNLRQKTIWKGSVTPYYFIKYRNLNINTHNHEQHWKIFFLGIGLVVCQHGTCPKSNVSGGRGIWYMNLGDGVFDSFLQSTNKETVARRPPLLQGIDNFWWCVKKCNLYAWNITTF